MEDMKNANDCWNIPWITQLKQEAKSGQYFLLCSATFKDQGVEELGNKNLHDSDFACSFACLGIWLICSRKKAKETNSNFFTSQGTKHTPNYVIFSRSLLSNSCKFYYIGKVKLNFW